MRTIGVAVPRLRIGWVHCEKPRRVRRRPAALDAVFACRKIVFVPHRALIHARKRIVRSARGRVGFPKRRVGFAALHRPARCARQARAAQGGWPGLLYSIRLPAFHGQPLQYVNSEKMELGPCPTVWRVFCRGRIRGLLVPITCRNSKPPPFQKSGRMGHPNFKTKAGPPALSRPPCHGRSKGMRAQF